MAQSSAAGVLSNIFTAPQAAFAAIKERPSPWLPLLVLMIGTFVVQYSYMQAVDLPWLLDQQLQAGGNLPEEQRRQAVDAALQVPATVLGAIQGIGGGLGILIVYALIALYYTGVSFATHDGVKYGQWLALIAWCSLPAVFGMAASFVNLAVSDARFMPAEQLNPLSFGSLLAIDPQGATVVERILLSLDVTVLWATVLQILGYQAFTQRSVAKATIVVLGPLALIVLIGSLAALT
jgi:hypothetical protein